MANYPIAFWISILLLVVPGLNAQTISPSNDTLPTQVDEQILNYSSRGMSSGVTVAPLTANVGLGGTQTSINQVRIFGTIKAADAHGGSITTDSIAFICCDPNSNSSNISPSAVVQQAVAVVPQGVLLYSLVNSHCSLDGTFMSGSSVYGSILTMTSVQDAQVLKTMLDSNPSGIQSAVIQSKYLATSKSSSGTPQGTPTPTTAVAMSILYSITGIITVLFIVIVATGAVRAHRHPERYGPRRGGLPGRPRQSRAKGLARAMLETLPIVKFGDPEPIKSENRDVELEDGMSSAHANTAVAPDSATSKSEDVTKPKAGQPAVPISGNAAGHMSGIGPDIQNEEAARNSNDDAEQTGRLGCSICTEDFEKGEDVRVLPCNHKYHPACIDPWLLNVSGTCPLCRVDLRGEAKDAPAEGSEEPLSPPLNDAEGTSAPTGTSSSHLGDIDLLRNAPANERIAALRGLRARQGAVAENHVDTVEQSRRARLTGRLRERFRIRTHAVAESSESNVVAGSVIQPESSTAAVSSPRTDRT